MREHQLTALARLYAEQALGTEMVFLGAAESRRGVWRVVFYRADNPACLYWVDTDHTGMGVSLRLHGGLQDD